MCSEAQTCLILLNENVVLVRVVQAAASASIASPILLET